MSESGVFRVSVPSVEHLSEPPKPFGQPAWLRAGAVIMFVFQGMADRAEARLREVGDE